MSRTFISTIIVAMDVDMSRVRYAAEGASFRVCQVRPTNASAAITTRSRNTIVVPPGSRVRDSIAAPTTPAQGIVRTQAIRMFPATPQRTALRRFVAPAPSTEPETVCVVETGKPRCAVVQRIAAGAGWAGGPPGGGG